MEIFSESNDRGGQRELPGDVTATASRDGTTAGSMPSVIYVIRIHRAVGVYFAKHQRLAPGWELGIVPVTFPRRQFPSNGGSHRFVMQPSRRR